MANWLIFSLTKKAKLGWRSSAPSVLPSTPFVAPLAGSYPASYRAMKHSHGKANMSRMPRLIFLALFLFELVGAIWLRFDENGLLVSQVSGRGVPVLGIAFPIYVFSSLLYWRLPDGFAADWPPPRAMRRAENAWPLRCSELLVPSF